MKKVFEHVLFVLCFSYRNSFFLGRFVSRAPVPVSIWSAHIRHDQLANHFFVFPCLTVCGHMI